MNYRTEIDKLLSTRYNYLITCAKNVLKKNRKSSLTAPDIVSELAIYLYSNKEKVEEYILRDKLEAFAVRWIDIQTRYATSQLNIKYDSTKFNELDEVAERTLQEISVKDDPEDIDKNEYELDLKNILSEEQIVKIMKIDGIINELTTSELILFKAYFIEDLSYDKIVKKYTFYREKDGKRIKYKSKKSIYNMMNELKNKILRLI